MVIKTFGTLIFRKDQWVMTEAQPHVCIKLKSIFPKIPRTGTVPFKFSNLPDVCVDLLWFVQRYPMVISKEDMDILLDGKNLYDKNINDFERILMPTYIPEKAILANGHEARGYQLVGADFHRRRKRYLLGDDVGLGKTLTGVLTFFNAMTRPGLVVVQTHLPKQWKESIEEFTNLKCHVIKGTKPYTLPSADIYIIKYSCLAGWVDIYLTEFFKSVIFDEVQELRIPGSNKYTAATKLSDSVEYCMGMSATPIYNYGDEIFYVLNLINPGCLGSADDFFREWTTYYGRHNKVTDPIALGSYLRDNFLMLRRTRKDVGRELPPVNKIIYDVGYDSDEAEKSEELTRRLAMTVLSGSFNERGQAARELDMRMRHTTGVAKAKEVAAFVRILLENDHPVILAGWHREVYEIWLKELEDFVPVMYTGTESPKQKEDSKNKFIAGETKLFIISLRSGIGIDGLQHVCQDVVIGELDWSPKVHDQIIGRADRDGQEGQVNAYFPVCEYGSDPVMIDILGLKSSQSHGIINTLLAVPEQFSDDSRIKRLAEFVLNKK